MARVDFQPAPCIGFFQLTAAFRQFFYMFEGFFIHGYLAHFHPALRLPDFCPDGILRRTVIGKSGIYHRQPGAGDQHIGIGKPGEQPFPDKTVKGVFFIKQIQPGSVKIPYIICQFSHFWQSPVRIQTGHKLVIGIGIIKGILRYPTGPYDVFQRFSGKCAHTAACRVVCNPIKKSTCVVFSAPCPVLQSQPAFYGNHQPSARRQMLFHNLHKRFIGIFTPDITLRILKYTN